MTDELTRSIRVIHDLERAIRIWELVRDAAQQVVNETTAHDERPEDVETSPAVAKARSYIATCNTLILAAKARIDKLAKGG